jgi:hypothetical protein
MIYAVRRHSRILLNTLTVLSMLLCLATVALWVRNYRVGDDVSVWRTAAETDREWQMVWCTQLQFLHGETRIDIYGSRYWAGSPSGRAWFVLDGFREPSPYPSWLGFRHYRDRRWEGGKLYFARWMLAVPCWSIALLTAALPLVRAFRWWRRGTRPRGVCRACGYDLRATPDRCPECGAIPAHFREPPRAPSV